MYVYMYILAMYLNQLAMGIVPWVLCPGTSTEVLYKYMPLIDFLTKLWSICLKGNSSTYNELPDYRRAR